MFLLYFLCVFFGFGPSASTRVRIWMHRLRHLWHLKLLKDSKFTALRCPFFIISEQVLAQWQCLVAFMKAMDLPHWAMRAVWYRRTATAIEMVNKVDIYCIIIMFSVILLAAVGAILIK